MHLIVCEKCSESTRFHFYCTLILLRMEIQTFVRISVDCMWFVVGFRCRFAGNIYFRIKTERRRRRMAASHEPSERVWRSNSSFCLMEVQNNKTSVFSKIFPLHVFHLPVEAFIYLCLWFYVLPFFNFIYKFLNISFVVILSQSSSCQIFGLICTECIKWMGRPLASIHTFHLWN